MISSWSRILQLKQEIAELDQKIVSSCSQKSDPLPIPQPPPSKKDQEREEIINRLNSLRVTTSGKSETLQTELTELQSKLKLLGIKKQAEISNSKNSRERISQKIEIQNKNLQSCYDEYQGLSAAIAKKQKMKDESAMIKAKAYEDALAPLEKEAERLEQEKTVAAEEQKGLQEEILVLENRYSMCKEEIISRYAQRAENIGEREEIEYLLETFELECPEELEFLDDEEVVMPSPRVLEPRLKKQLQGIENSIESNKALIETLKQKYSGVVQDIEAMLTNSMAFRSNAEILMIEKAINEKTLEFDLDSLENVILDLNTLERFDIDEEILRMQMVEVVKCENQLRVDLEYEEKERLEVIQCRMMENKDVTELEEELNSVRNKYRNRFAAIGQWKEEVEAVVSKTVSNIYVAVSDRTIVEEFCAGLGKVSGLSTKQQIKSLIEGYLSKVSMRDKTIQGSLQDIKQKFTERAQLAGMLTKAHQDKSKLQSERMKFTKDQTVDEDKENLLSRPGLYEKSLPPLSKKVLSLRSAARKLDAIIASEANVLEKSACILSNLICEAKTSRKQFANNRYMINKIISEEHSLHFQIEKVLENKRKDMLNSLQELSVSSKDSDESRLEALKEKIDTLTSEVELSTKEMNKIDSDSQANIAVHKQEESILRTHIQVIESALRNVESENKKIKEMEIQLLKLEEADAAPIPECLQDQNRAKSVSRVHQCRRNENFNSAVTDPREIEDSVIIHPGNNYLEFVEKALNKNPRAARQASSVHKPQIISIGRGSIKSYKKY